MVTLGDIMDAALHPDDYRRRPGVTLAPRLENAIVLADAIRVDEDKYGGKARIRIDNAFIWLNNIIIPSDKQCAIVP